MKNDDTVNVPREATEAMIRSAVCEYLPPRQTPEDIAVAIYRAMIAAAPKAEPDWNYEGAMADLQSAITVLIRRINGEADLASAAEWVRLNYPSRAPEIVAQPEAPKVEQEPVAWQYRRPNGNWGDMGAALISVGGKAVNAPSNYEVRALYPLPAPASDELQSFADFIADEAHNLDLTKKQLEIVKAAFRALIGRYNAKHKGPQS